ncbi:amidase [Pendulispora albinea]|uniref:Amidase n=1 Tax=Pendulispora albinea TaxID=2741071 RepID=A0ABZ2M9U6_9BACT
MNRRAFLTGFTGTASGLAFGFSGGCGGGPSRASPPAAGPASVSQANLPAAQTAWPHPELEETTVAELGARMKRGELSARELVDAYTARIEAIDRRGPELRSVIELNPDARAIAIRLDEERKAKGPRGPLHGIPVLVKDNLDTGDGMQTTAGSLALAGSRASRDAHVVERLREAGAVILGKTNLSEWANIRDTHSISGWSARGKLTRNPYALNRNTSGSSSGSAAAIAANLAAVSIGTETDGSIVSPASLCGLVGLKPTLGLVSRAGIVPIAHSQDTAGPMTRTVADTAVVLGAIAGSDARDPATAQARAERDYTRFLDAQGARGVRIGVVRGEPWMIPALSSAFENALTALRKLGAIVVDLEPLPPNERGLRTLRDVTRALEEPELEVLLYELKADMAAYLATRPNQPLRTLEDVVRWNREHARDEMPWFQQDLFEKALQKGGLDAAPYREALATCRKLARDEGIDRALSAQKLDIIVTMTGGAAWITDTANGDIFTGSSSTLPAVAGYPSVSVPCGEVRGLPLGVLFFGGAWSEPALLRVAYAYERATQLRKKPTFVRSIDAL